MFSLFDLIAQDAHSTTVVNCDGEKRQSKHSLLFYNSSSSVFESFETEDLKTIKGMVIYILQYSQTKMHNFGQKLHFCYYFFFNILMPDVSLNRMKTCL